MKRKLISILLLCCCAASLLVTRAAATEIEIATGDALMRVYKSSDNSVKYQNPFSDSFEYLHSNELDSTMNVYYYVTVPISIQGNHTYVITVSFHEEYWSTQDYISSINYFDRLMVSRGNSLIEYDIDNDTTEFNGFSMYRSVSNASDSSGLLRLVTVSFIVDDPTITNFSFYTKSHKMHTVSGDPIVIRDITDASLDDVVAEVIRLTNATNYSAGSTTEGLASIHGVLEGRLSELYDSVEGTGFQTRKAIDTLTKEMPELVEEGTKNALNKFYDELKQEASDKLSSAVDELSQKMPVNVAALQTSFNQLYNSVTTHSTNASLTLPAGSVTLMGNTYTFWDASNVSFNEFFSLPIVTLLLIPLRFVFVFGMGKYLISYFDKLVKLITLHVQGGN